jgi:hypothetical protein
MAHSPLFRFASRPPICYRPIANTLRNGLRAAGPGNRWFQIKEPWQSENSVQIVYGAIRAERIREVAEEPLGVGRLEICDVPDHLELATA